MDHLRHVPEYNKQKTTHTCFRMAVPLPTDRLTYHMIAVYERYAAKMRPTLGLSPPAEQSIRCASAEALDSLSPVAIK